MIPSALLPASAAAGSGAAAARRAAAAILAERRFHPSSVPRPLHGPLEAIGRAVRDALNAIGHPLGGLADSLPGGPALMWTLLAAGLAVLTLRVLRGHSRRRLARQGAGVGEGPGRDPDGADELERAATRAEQEGRLADAVRLRFRAGLARLAERGQIEAPVAMPSATVSRRLRSTKFDALARRFDEIVYGRRPAVPDDVEQARREWADVLRGGRRP